MLGISRCNYRRKKEGTRFGETDAEDRVSENCSKPLVSNYMCRQKELVIQWSIENFVRTSSTTLHFAKFSRPLFWKTRRSIVPVSLIFFCIRYWNMLTLRHTTRPRHQKVLTYLDNFTLTRTKRRKYSVSLTFISILGDYISLFCQKTRILSGVKRNERPLIKSSAA